MELLKFRRALSYDHRKGVQNVEKGEGRRRKEYSSVSTLLSFMSGASFGTEKAVCNANF